MASRDIFSDEFITANSLQQHEPRECFPVGKILVWTAVGSFLIISLLRTGRRDMCSSRPSNLKCARCTSRSSLLSSTSPRGAVRWIEAPRSFIPSPPVRVMSDDDAFSAAAGSIRSRGHGGVFDVVRVVPRFFFFFAFYGAHTRWSRFPFSPSAPRVDTCNCAILV